MKDFKDKVAFITGGGAGLGLGLTKVFSEAGCKVVIADIRQDHLDEAMEYFDDKDAEVHPINLDITDREAFARAADEVEEVFGKSPELLFNNAGVNTFGPAEATTYDDWDWILGVNLFGVINGITTFLPRMIKAGRGGHIYTTSSAAGLSGSPVAMPYSASKAALINMMESYRLSLKHYGISVSVCCPEAIDSKIGESIYTRPEHLKNTGYVEDEKIVEALSHVYATGIDPVELATYIKDRIEKGIFYIIPPGTGRALEPRFKEMINSIPPAPPKSPEEQKRIREGFSYMKYVGGIRPELTWIKKAPPRRMHQDSTSGSEENK